MKQTRVILSNLPISLMKFPLMLLCIWVDLLSLPFRWTERLLFNAKIKKQQIQSSPVFIIGHWRSGTTFLHQLLSSDEQFGYINFYTAMFPNAFLCTESIMKPLLNKIARLFKWRIPFFNNIQYQFDFPCEEDTALLNMGSRWSAYWAYAFPQKAMSMFANTMYFKAPGTKTGEKFMNDYLYLLKKISYKYRGKRLLLKSPPNTARIRFLLKKFPGAKFIYLKRNPAEMYCSHLQLWKRCLKHYALQKIEQAELDAVIIATMKNMRDQYNEDRNLLRSDNLYEVSYDKFINAPLNVIKEIYEQLEIPGFAQTQNEIKAQINQSKKYSPFSYGCSEEKIKWIEANMAAC